MEKGKYSRVFAEAEQAVNAFDDFLDKTDPRIFEVRFDPGDEVFLAELIRIHFPLPEDTLEYVRIEPLDPDDPSHVAFTVKRLNSGHIEPNTDPRWKDSISDSVVVGLHLRDMDLINQALEKQVAINAGINPDFPDVSYETQRQRQEGLFRRFDATFIPTGFVRDINKAFQDSGAPIRPSFAKRFEYNI